jgi:hypothetical protein
MLNVHVVDRDVTCCFCCTDSNPGEIFETARLGRRSLTAFSQLRKLYDQLLVLLFLGVLSDHSVRPHPKP